MYRHNTFEENNENMITARSTYGKLVRSRTYLHEQLQTRQLENLRFKNAKEYWKMIKCTCVQDKVGNVDANNFA